MYAIRSYYENTVYLDSQGNYDESYISDTYVTDKEITSTTNSQLNNPKLFIDENFLDLLQKSFSNTIVITSYSIHYTKLYESRERINIKKVSEGITYLAENIMVFHDFTKVTDYEKRNSRFFLKEKDAYVPDDFRDEIALGIITKKGLVIIGGCSHVGIVNILKTISERVNLPIYAVIGGTHLVEADESRIQKTMDAFKEMNIQLIAVSHCTGDKRNNFV